MNKADKYIKIFNEIENYLRKSLNEPNGTRFIDLLNLSKNNGNHVIKRYDSELKEHGKLRNNIAHKNGTEYFATPTDIAITHLDSIKNHLIKPRKVKDFIKNTPYTLEADTNLNDVLNLMHKNDFSQFPIYKERKYIGVLSTNTISRWLSSSKSEDGEIIKELNKVKAEDVLKYNESSDEAIFIQEKITVYEFLSKVEENMNNHIWIMTLNGKRDQKPLRLVTPYDYDELYNYVAFKKG